MPLRPRHLAAIASAVTLAVMGTAATGAIGASARPVSPRHVLLISVDGLHESDLALWVAEHPDSNLAQLVSSGLTYENASTTQPSDSFPGLLSEVTGATPKSTGVFYDVSYSRTLFAPGSNCTGPKGTVAAYDESIDVGASTASRTVLGETIDPAALPEAIVAGKCAPVFPNEYLRTNSIFSVAQAAGLRTAWTDKHPAYQLVNGHGTPDAVDDLFTPEINADLVPASLVDTRGKTITFPHPNPDGMGPYFITDYVGNTEAYDQIKVDAVLNQIDGRSADRSSTPGEPAIFGMNFQSVSVGEKNVDPSKTCDPARNDGTPCRKNYVPGGYQPGTLAFTPQLEGAIAYVDRAIGSLVAELRARNEFDSTEIIVTAKHGQSPIDPSKLQKIGSAEATVLSDAGIAVSQVTDDDVSLIWLQNQADTHRAVTALKASIAQGNPARIAKVLSGQPLREQFGDPLHNGRTPDIIVEPIPGTIYSTSHAKVAEHGGFAADDIHVALVVVNGGGDPGRGVRAPVHTTQIAPTILDALGLDPHALDGVRLEGTQMLPDLDP
jgi:Type I phosphodiesterase / nucleotide pyrophosphatase